MVIKEQMNRYCEANLIRSISTLGIVIFHTLNALDKQFGYKYAVFYLYPKGNCGDVFVAIFFILSGFLLYKRYADKKLDVIGFYKKRWMSIFPAYYFSWTFFFIVRVLVEKKPILWGGAIYKIILTVLGMDGYFSYKWPNYYLVGEWFLGAIIILYLVFPLLLKIVKKTSVMVVVAIVIAWLWQINTNIFTVNSYRNIISCLVSFVAGILLAKHYNYILKLEKNPLVIGIETVFYLICRLYRLPINTNILMHIMGLILYLLFVSLAIMIPETNMMKACAWISSVSFGIYLVHHRIIYMMVPYLSKGDKLYDTTISLLICLTASILLGYLVSSFSNTIKRSWRIT